MRELTETLKSVMAVVSNQLELLPASEGAVEEMTYVDEEERDDTKLVGDNLLVEASLEIPKPTWKYCKLQQIERQLFVHYAVFRQPVKIVFPMPTYRQD